MTCVSLTSNCLIVICNSLVEIDKQLIYRFHNAARDGDVSLVKKLLDAGVPVDSAKLPFGITALRWAARNNRTDVTRILLQRGAEVDKRTGDDQWTALHVAALNNNTDVIEILLKHGASTKIKNCDGCTPIYYARRWNHEAAVRLLEQH